MTSRERVLAALNHKEPDKVPIDLGGTMCSSLTRTASDNLNEYLNLPVGNDFITNPLSDSVAISEEVLNLFEVDFRTVRMKGPDSPQDTTAPENGIKDEFGTIWMKAGFDYVPTVFSYAEADLGNLDKLPEPDPYDKGRMAGVRKEAEVLRETTDFAVIADFVCGGPFEQAQRIRGFEQFLIDLYTDPKFAVALLDKLTDNAIGFWDAMLSQTGDLVDIVCQGDDLGMQTGLIISPEMYQKFIKPCHQRLFDFIHSKTDAKLWLHSCGSVYDIIPDLIDIGVDVLNPVQVSAKNMGLKKLKSEYGKNISFWGGGIDIQRLPFLKDEGIGLAVREALEIMAPDGGYVFAASHNILPETEGQRIHVAYMNAVRNR